MFIYCPKRFSAGVKVRFLMLICLCAILASSLISLIIGSATLVDTSYYDLLQISHDATNQQIYAAYVKIRNEYNPDWYMIHREEAVRLHHIIRHVARILLNPRSRQYYDKKDFHQFHLDVSLIIVLKASLDPSLAAKNLLTPAFSLDLGKHPLEYVLCILKDAHRQNNVGWFIEVLRYLQATAILSPSISFDQRNSFDFDQFRGFLQSIEKRFRPVIPKEDKKYTVLDRIFDISANLGRTDFLIINARQFSPETIYLLLCREPLAMTSKFLQYINSPIDFSEMIQSCPNYKRTDRKLLNNPSSPETESLNSDVDFNERYD